jgi:hypothetical protein
MKQTHKVQSHIDRYNQQTKRFLNSDILLEEKLSDPFVYRFQKMVGREKNRADLDIDTKDIKNNWPNLIKAVMIIDMNGQSHGEVNNKRK